MMIDYEKWLDQLLSDNDHTLQPYERQAAMWALYNIGMVERVDRDIEDFYVYGGFLKSSLGWGHPYETMAWGFEARNWTASDDPSVEDGQTFVFHMSFTEDCHGNRLGMAFEFSGYNLADEHPEDLSDFSALLQKNMFPA